MPVVLDCASWGIVDPRQLGWLDPPSPSAIAEAKARLQAIGALGDDGRITEHGKALAAVPLPVPLAHMLLDAAAAGEGDLAGELAVLLTEPGLGGRGADVEARLGHWRGIRGERAEGARRLARRLAGVGGRLASGPRTDETRSIGGWIATAWPDRVARQRAGQRGEYLSVGGEPTRSIPSTRSPMPNGSPSPMRRAMPPASASSPLRRSRRPRSRRSSPIASSSRAPASMMPRATASITGASGDWARSRCRAARPGAMRGRRMMWRSGLPRFATKGWG